MKPIWVLRPEGFSLKERALSLRAWSDALLTKLYFFKSTLADIYHAEREFCAKLVTTACSTSN